MAEDNLTKDSESDVFTIPEEFYGAERKAPPVSFAAGASSKKSLGVPLAVPATASKASYSKRSLNFSSPKVVITAVVILMIIVVGGFSYYYINQAQVARQKMLDAQKPKEQPVVIPQPVPPAPTPVEVPVEATSTPTNIPQPVSFAIFPFQNYTKSEDTDNDELTNTEEAIYGTTADKPDTDEDGFPDGLEVINLYNPLGFKPVRLIDSGKIKSYFNPTYTYSILNPLVWVARSLDTNNEQVIFSSDSGEFVEIIVEDNPLKLSVTNWYLGQSPGVSASDLKTITTKDNLAGILSPDGLAAYFPFEDRIFIIYYNIGLKTEVNFLSTFKMMLNSFKVGAGAVPIVEEVTATSTNP